MLEWGQLTDSPGSRCRDADGSMVFTGSLVQGPALSGEVLGLVSLNAVSVAWSDGTKETVDPQLLRVRAAFS